MRRRPAMMAYNKASNKSGNVVGIALGDSNISLQPPLESKFAAKPLQQDHSPEVSEMSLLERKTQRAKPFRHT